MRRRNLIVKLLWMGCGWSMCPNLNICGTDVAECDSKIASWGKLQVPSGPWLILWVCSLCMWGCSLRDCLCQFCCEGDRKKKDNSRIRVQTDNLRGLLGITRMGRVSNVGIRVMWTREKGEEKKWLKYLPIFCSIEEWRMIGLLKGCKGACERLCG